MKLRRRYFFASAALALLGVVVATLWMRHTPEPRYQGIRFSVFLDEYWKNPEMAKTGRQAVKEMGSSVVPYLVSEMENDPVRDLMFKIKPSMPDKIASVFPDQSVYAKRRTRAAGLLTEAGTNAVSALPRLIEITEAESPDYTHNFIRAIGMLAPGTEYHDRARKLVLRVVTEARSERDSETRRMCYHILGMFGGDEVVPALIDGLRERRMVDSCIESLVKIGTNAVPELKKVAAHESGYVRPAGVALEKIERKIREDQELGRSN
jgi:hypothetical protein